MGGCNWPIHTTQPNHYENSIGKYVQPFNKLLVLHETLSTVTL